MHASRKHKRRHRKSQTLDSLGESFHVEFKVRKNDVWTSACETWPDRAKANKWIKDSITELKAEGNPVGKFRVVEGPSTGCNIPSTGDSAFQWVTLLGVGALLYLGLKA